MVDDKQGRKSIKAEGVHTVFIGLGSNLDTPEKHVCDAVNDIDNSKSIKVLDVSPLYESEPMVLQELHITQQPNYINAVLKAETTSFPLQLLETLQSIEQRHGRIRNRVQWSPRTLDLDILLYDDLQIEEPGLRLPHYGLAQRNFVLYPLYDVAGGTLEIPTQGVLVDLLKQCSRTGLKRLHQC